MGVVELPSAQHRVEQPAVAGGAVDIQEPDPSVTIGRMGMAATGVPNAFEIPIAELPHPGGIDMLIRVQHIRARAAGGEVGQHQPRRRKIVLPLQRSGARVAGSLFFDPPAVPLRPGFQETVRIAVARAGRRVQPVGQEHERIAFLTGPGWGRQQPIGSAARLERVDHLVHALPKLSVFAPPQGVPCSHQELGRVGGERALPAPQFPRRLLTPANSRKRSTISSRLASVRR